jgi:imidazolonepropionase-like amidohydrolase
LEKRFAALYPAWAEERFAVEGQESVEKRAANMRPVLSTVEAVSKSGGHVIAGTGSPAVPYGLGLILEIELISEAGLGPIEAIRSATQVAADALGVGDELGSVEPGKRADLVILSGDPSEDIRNLRTVEQVIVDGRLVGVSQLLRK